MYAISSYRGKLATDPQTNKQTHRQDRLQYTAQLSSVNRLIRRTSSYLVDAVLSDDVVKQRPEVVEKVHNFHRTALSDARTVRRSGRRQWTLVDNSGHRDVLVDIIINCRYYGVYRELLACVVDL